MRTSRRTQQASVVRGTSRGRFATGRAQISSGQRTCMGPTLPRRGSRWRHKTSYPRHSGQTIEENCSTQKALQASGIGHSSTTPSNPKTVPRGRRGPRSSARRSTWSSWRRKIDDPVKPWNSKLKCAGKMFHRSARPLGQRAPGASTRSCKSAATPSRFVEDVIWHRTRHLTPNSWPAILSNTQPTAGSALRI